MCVCWAGDTDPEENEWIMKAWNMKGLGGIGLQFPHTDRWQLGTHLKDQGLPWWRSS